MSAPRKQPLGAYLRPNYDLYLTYSAARHGDLYAAHYRHYHRYSLEHKDPAERERYYYPLIPR